MFNIKDKVISEIEKKAEIIGNNATEKMYSQFKETFEAMSQMISDTQDNQIELADKIDKIEKKIDEILTYIKTQ